MAADPVTPVAGVSTIVSVGSVPVVVVPGNPNGGILQNPYSAVDEGLSSPEVLLVDPVGLPLSTPGNANGTTFALYPGQAWFVIPGQTTPTRANAATSGHKFSGIYW